MPYPIFMNLQGRSCVIVGGGRVAERRMDSLAIQGALVTIVSPEATVRISATATAEDDVRWIPETFQPCHLDEAFLVIAATDNREVNALVAQAARERGVLVCRADEPESGDFITPAVVERGALTIALSTGGASPTLAAVLIERLRAEYGPEWAAFTDLFAQLRPRIQAAQPDSLRRKVVETILDNDAVADNLRKGDEPAALAEAMRCF